MLRRTISFLSLVILVFGIFTGLFYLLFFTAKNLPVIVRPEVTPIHISAQMVMDTINAKRKLAGLPALAVSDDLCQLGDTILTVIKSSWATGTFKSYAGVFHAQHPDYSGLAMQAANLDLGTPEKITSWLDTSEIAGDVVSPVYNSLCVVTDGSYTLQLMARYSKVQAVKPKVVVPTAVPAPDTSAPWGIARQINEHTWSIRVGQDDTMASPSEILAALNVYRNRYGSQTLAWDQKLADFAATRAKYIDSIKKTDDHKGFMDYLENQDGFAKLGFTSLGENMSYGYRLSGVHFIEWIYAGDEPHNANQLNNKWNYVGIGVYGLGNCIIFGTGRS